MTGGGINIDAFEDSEATMVVEKKNWYNTIVK